MNGASSNPNWVIAVHGGAGVWRDELSGEREKSCREVIAVALRAGASVLERSGSGIEAVEAAVQVLEDSPLFNAGKGAVLSHEGNAELDASIMDGATRRAGAIAAVRRVKNPISAARLVMERSPHVLLVGTGAEQFVKACGVSLISPRSLVTAERKAQLKAAIAEERARLGREADPSAHDMIGTVGAVALDLHGNLAAATSTGGMVNKRWGRVGDSPLIGAGTYASNDTCAVSATGHGEFFIRATAAHQLATRMAWQGLGLMNAADAVLADIASLGGQGGLIAIDRSGNIAMPFNTEGMFRGALGAGKPPYVSVFPDSPATS